MRKVKRTYDLAEKLMDSPEVVADIFKDFAAGGLAAVMEGAALKHPHFELTHHFVRQIVHRERPFNQAVMFSKVTPEDAEAVSSRFKHKPMKPLSATKEVNGEYKAVLHDVIDARVAYKQALERAVDVGWDYDTLKALADITAETIA